MRIVKNTDEEKFCQHNGKNEKKKQQQNGHFHKKCSTDEL